MAEKSSDNKEKESQQPLPLMVRIMEWVVFAYLLIMAILYFPSVSSLLTLIAALLALPVKKLQKLYLKIFLRRWIQVIVALLIYLAALIYAPAPPAPEPNEYFGEITEQNYAMPRPRLPSFFVD